MTQPTSSVTSLQNSTTAKAATPSASLGQVDFMKLIVAQMQNQNPLDPQSNTDFMAQMAQFEALNQMTAMAQGMKSLQAVNELSSAASMVGRNVTGKQVDATSAVRELVANQRFSLSYEQLNNAQKVTVDTDDRVTAAINDKKNAGTQVTGRVDQVVVGPDGIPMVMVNGKVIDMFTVSQVQ